MNFLLEGKILRHCILKRKTGKRVKAGRQVYVVYPIISESEKSDLRAAIEMHKELKGIFPGIIIELLHGRMKSQDKDKIMEGFRDNKINILVSTIVIEVGVDVPNATCIIVEHAERFGLSQLHQLRGRVGRGGFVSSCILIANPKTEEAVRRIEAMLRTQDGFKIAEEDLSIRGPGEFFGTEQHGFPELKISDIIRDRKTLEIARYEAFEMIQKDRFLIQAEHQLIKNMVRKRFKKEELELVNIA
jgi:ATP-dependent DNA helicase RecG